MTKFKVHYVLNQTHHESVVVDANNPDHAREQVRTTAKEKNFAVRIKTVKVVRDAH